MAKVTTSGTFTEYTIPTINSQPIGIAAGPDGNLWLTEASGNKVAKIVASVPSPTPYPSALRVPPTGVGPGDGAWPPAATIAS